MTVARGVIAAISDLRGLAEHAYENGYHEIGYNPVKVVSDEIERLRAALSSISKRLAANLAGKTHWTGCEEDHPMCAVGRIAEDALAGSAQNQLNEER